MDGPLPIRRSDMEEIEAMADLKNKGRLNLLCKLGLHRWKPWKIRVDGQLAIPNLGVLGYFRDKVRSVRRQGG